MKKFTLDTGGIAWFDLKSVTAIVKKNHENGIRVHFGGDFYLISVDDIDSENFVENLVAEIDAAKFGVIIETETFDGAPLPNKNGSITTVNKYVFPIGNLDALYIKGNEVRAIFKGVDDVIFRFETQHRDTPANSLDYLAKLASYTTLTKVDDRLYVNSDAVNNVIVERNEDNHFDVKLVIGDEKVTVDCEFEANDAFDVADNAKSKFGIK